MRILELTLENVKCFASLNKAFSPGINFICGKNGAGKSTMVEAIGLCLFGAGAEGSSTSYFLRDGAKIGEISVRFRIENEEYCMRRRLRTGSMPRTLFDGAGNELDLHGDADIDQFLREQLKLPAGQSLSRMFNQVVGVRQGTLTQPFLQPPNERKKLFHAMLGVERYRNALLLPSGMANYLQETIAAHTTRIEVCRSHTDDLADTRAALATAQSTHATAQAALDAAQAQADAALAALNEIVERQTKLKEAQDALLADRAKLAEQQTILHKQRQADSLALSQSQAALAQAQIAVQQQTQAYEDATQAAKQASEACEAFAAQDKAQRAQDAAVQHAQTRRQSVWEARLNQLRDTIEQVRDGKCPFLHIPCTSVPSLDDELNARIAQGEAMIEAQRRQDQDVLDEQERATHARKIQHDALREAARKAQDALQAATRAQTQATTHRDELQKRIKELTEQETNAAKREIELHDARIQLDAREEAQRKAQAGADPAALAAAQERRSTLSNALGQAQAQEKSSVQEVLRLSQEVTRKEKLWQDLLAQEDMRKHVQAVQSLYNELTAMLRLAGERMAQVYRERLSAQATLLYRGISGDTARLIWTEQYDIQLLDNHLGAPRCREFRQLSGGEQMSAALALRFALLEQLTPIGMAFFDEPTANLDGTRREALARILPRVTAGFEQVFVISHDDTFDAIGDTVVAL